MQVNGKYTDILERNRLNGGNGSRLNGNGNGNETHKIKPHIATEAEREERMELIGEQHISTGLETPLREGAFDISDDEKVRVIEHHFKEILHTLGMDLNDDSIQGTPRRVAKMYVKEIFKGLKPENRPAVSVFDNSYDYAQMLVEKNIKVKSTCEHHFLPILGKAHIAYYSSGKVIGLSKLNRFVDYFSRRPQVQERLTRQIAEELKKILNTEDIAIVIEAEHHCVICRGIEDEGSTTITSEYSGKFKEASVKDEFLRYLQLQIS